MVERVNQTLMERGKDYLRRYGPSELAAGAASWSAAKLTYGATQNAAYAGLAGTWAGNLAYVATYLGREYGKTKKKVESEGRKIGWRDIGRIVTNQGAEFGPSGAIDAFVSRPACIAAGIKEFGPDVGPVVGGSVANILFYGMVIGAYELFVRKRDKSNNANNGIGSPESSSEPLKQAAN